MTAGLRLAAGLAALLLAGCGGEPDDPQPEAAPSTTHSVSSAPASSPVPTTRESIPPSLPQPYIAQVVWAQTEVGPSLQVYPTQAGREVSGDDVEQLAWDEVLVLEPAARTAAAMVESLRKRRRGRWDMVESLVDGKKV